MKPLFSFVLLLGLSLPAAAQSRGLFSDSVDVAGMAPFPQAYLKQQHITTVKEYYMGKRDSILHRTYIFDSAGNLARVLLHARNNTTLIDSLTYDQDNRRMEHFIGKIYLSRSRYSGDSILSQTTIQRPDGHIDTVFGETILNARGQILVSREYNPDGKLIRVSRHSYDGLGRTIQFEVDDLLHPELNYVYQYEYKKRHRSSTVILWSHRSKKPVKSAEYIFNELNQCIGWTYFSQPYNYLNSCSYRSDGSLYEIAREYRNIKNEPYGARSRFFYFN